MGQLMGQLMGTSIGYESFDVLHLPDTIYVRYSHTDNIIINASGLI